MPSRFSSQRLTVISPFMVDVAPIVRSAIALLLIENWAGRYNLHVPQVGTSILAMALVVPTLKP
jgi:hypothetical protein